jgi:cytochrome c-type biogenesis protein CcmH
MKQSILLGLVLSLFSSLALAALANPLTEEQVGQQVREISKTLRCAVCQSESVWESGSELASQMRAIVRERVIAGETGDEIRAYFVSRYGDFILLKPRVKGLNRLIWFGPFLLMGIAAILLYRKLKSWQKVTEQNGPLEELSDSDRKRIEEALK